jgi:hypothetical protein
MQRQAMGGVGAHQADGVVVAETLGGGVVEAEEVPEEAAEGEATVMATSCRSRHKRLGSSNGAC